MSFESQLVKAKLRVILMADAVTVAEVENPGLWQQVLGEIQGIGNPAVHQKSAFSANLDVCRSEQGSDPQSSSTAIDRFSHKLQIDRTQAEGAIAPTTDAPYLTLDIHCWEKMKKQVTGKGSTVPALAVAATLLALWCREASLETPSQSQAQAVLRTLGVQDKNASRAIRSVSWLQSRPGGQILINPAQNSKALLMAKCFCTGDWAEWAKQQPTNQAN